MSATNSSIHPDSTTPDGPDRAPAGGRLSAFETAPPLDECIPVFPDAEAPGPRSESAGSTSQRQDSADVCGGDPLGSPPHNPDTGMGAIPVSRSGRDGSDGPLRVVSTPEQISAAKAFYKAWTANENAAQREHAKNRSTVFSIMQYREHPETGAVLWTQEQWDGLIAALDVAGVLERHVAIWHDKDELPDGRPKPLHFHGVVRLIPGAEKQVRFIAIRASLPASRIRTPRDSYAEGKVVTGRLAADLAEFDFNQYLVHEDERSRDDGKHLYPRESVLSNFDFSEFLDAGRPAKAKRQGRLKETDVDRLAMRIRNEGLTLDEADAADPLAFNKGETRMKRARAQYLASLPQPPHRINFYFWGDGGTGKDALARALARALVPGDWVPGEKEPFFVVGEDNAEFEGYDGEPIVIIEEATAASLIVQLKGRRNAFKYLNPFPAKARKNVKGASTLPVNAITIITGPEPYERFLEGLAGTYVDKHGTPHTAENDAQSFRRFPIIIPVRSDEFDILINRGFIDDEGSFREYIAYEGFRQNMRQVLRRVKGIEPVERRIETHLAIEAKQVAPIKAHYESVVASVSSEGEDPEALLAEFAYLGEANVPDPGELAAATEREKRAHDEQLERELERVAEANRLAQVCTCPRDRAAPGIGYDGIFSRAHDGGCPVLIAREVELRAEVGAE